MITFYNQDGKAIAYLDSDMESIYLYSGQPVAWLSDDSLYAYSGKYLGRFENGWVRDRNGNCVFFTDNAQGGPLKPMKKMKPIRGIRQVRPIRGIREMRSIRSMNSLAWSTLSNELFFSQ